MAEIIKLKNQKTDINWNTYLATAYAEGFCEGEGATLIEQVEAWACLIKTGLCYKLQGWFGRNANNIIEKGIINEKGVINWDLINE